MLPASNDHWLVHPTGGSQAAEGGALSHYKSNLRDIKFNLFEMLRRQDLLGAPPSASPDPATPPSASLDPAASPSASLDPAAPPYPDLDEETVRSILDEVNRLATGPLAGSFAETDRNPPVFDPATGTVRMSEGFKRSYRAWTDAQWWR